MLVGSLFFLHCHDCSEIQTASEEASQRCRETSFSLPFPVTRAPTVTVPHTSPGPCPSALVRHLQATTPRKDIEFSGLQNNICWNLSSSPLNTVIPSPVWGILFGTVDQEDRGRLFTAVHCGRRKNCRYKLRWARQTGYNKNLGAKNTWKCCDWVCSAPTLREWWLLATSRWIYSSVTRGILHQPDYHWLTPWCGNGICLAWE